MEIWTLLKILLSLPTFLLPPGAAFLHRFLLTPLPTEAGGVEGISPVHTPSPATSTPPKNKQKKSLLYPRAPLKSTGKLPLASAMKYLFPRSWSHWLSPFCPMSIFIISRSIFHATSASNATSYMPAPQPLPKHKYSPSCTELKVKQDSM